MWFRFSRPDYFYVGHYRLVAASDSSPWNRGVSIGVGFFVLHARWNEGRSESEGVHYPTQSVHRITINGTEWAVSGDVMSYDRLLAFTNQRTGATVTYWDRRSDKAGTLSPGQRVLLSDGMAFTAVHTSAA